MVDTLGAVLAIIDRDPEPAGTFLLCQLLGHVHQMPQQVLLVLSRLGQLRQPIPCLGNDEEMDGRLGGNVAKGQADVVLVDDVSGDFPGKDPVKNGGRVSVACSSCGGRRQLSLFNFVRG